MRWALGIIYYAALGWASWLLMMLLHEAGHVAGALLSGAHVAEVIWHPLSISRTAVEPNPRPLFVAWSGPIVGAIAPWLACAALRVSRFRTASLPQFFAGFCLLANGLYIGIGAAYPVGDARDLLRLGTPRTAMVSFGLVTSTLGLWQWHTAAFPRSPGAARVALTVSAAVALTLFAAAVGQPEN